MEQITTEMLLSLINRINEYGIIKYGKEPTEVKITDDGKILLNYPRWGAPWGGLTDTWKRVSLKQLNNISK